MPPPTFLFRLPAAVGATKTLSELIESSWSGMEQFSFFVFLHGLSSCKETWGCVLDNPRMGANSFLFAADLLGYGDNPVQMDDDLSLEKQIASIHELVVDHLNLPKKFVLVGHSMGSRVAIPFAAKYPSLVQTLVVEDMDVEPREAKEWTEEQLELMQHYTKHSPNLDVVKAQVIPFGFDETSVERWMGQGRIRQLEDGSYHSGWHPYCDYASFRTLLATRDTHEAFATLSGPEMPPVLVLLGEETLTLPSSIAEMESAVPSAVFKTIKGSDHSIHRTQNEEFVNELLQLIK